MNAAASAAAQAWPAGAAFSRKGAFVIVAGGLALLVALLYLIGTNQGTGVEGQAHAASNGLNGYSGLARLVEAQGYGVDRSRNPAGFTTDGLLVLTPPPGAQAEDIEPILKQRLYTGPTLVILPKWFAIPPPATTPAKARARFKRGWVILGRAAPSDWPARLSGPFALTHRAFAAPPNARLAWRGVGLPGTPAGDLPTRTVLYAEDAPFLAPLITDTAGRALAVRLRVEDAPKGGSGDDTPSPVIFVAEADLVNNYGMADATRAAAALALVEMLTADDGIDTVTFDLTLNGFGASENLLTLAFRPPFLAATLSLLAALLIVGWRAFQRFGPAATTGGPDIAFGKRQLITNGAGLIVRARRFGLLGAPYAALSARRIAERLGLARADIPAIDAALARRLPTEEPFSHRAARMQAARTPADLVAAAQALGDLETRLTQGTTTR